MKWTTGTVEWVEQIYAWHEVKCINDGEISIAELFQVMNEVFDMNVKNFYSYFRDIKNRKDGNRTKFLDTQKNQLLKKMENEDRKPSWK